jgi:hypothetical protein
MRQIIILVSFLLCGAVILSCDNPSTKKLEFFYYPSRNVYYDVSNSLYLYSLDGGKNWDSISIKTNKEPATLGVKRIIYSTSADVWKDNAQHVSEFNGQVINITGNDSNSLQNNSVAERKIKKQKAPVMNVPKPEKKPGFFKRLFGKKN